MYKFTSTTYAGNLRASKAVAGLGTAPINLYVALLTAKHYTSVSAATQLATEVTTPGTNGYSRQLFIPTDPTQTGWTANSNGISFGPFTSALSNVVETILVTEATGTSCDVIVQNQPLKSVSIAVNDELEILVGDYRFEWIGGVM